GKTTNDADGPSVLSFPDAPFGIARLQRFRNGLRRDWPHADRQRRKQCQRSDSSNRVHRTPRGTRMADATLVFANAISDWVVKPSNRPRRSRYHLHHASSESLEEKIQLGAVPHAARTLFFYAFLKPFWWRRTAQSNIRQSL